MWLAGVVSRKWVWLVGGIYGCGYQEVGVVISGRYIDFLILLIPTPLVLAPFCSSISTFCSFFKYCLFFFYVLFV